MARLTRKNLKIFASGASNNGIFGSLQANNPVTTTDIEQIQSLPAWVAGWDSATETSEKLPPLEESQAIDYVETYQTAYIFQEGVPEWLSTCEYHKGSWVKSDVSGKWALYESLIDNNVGNVVSDTSKWQDISADSQKRNIGEIVTSTIPLSDAGLHLLDGTLISGSGSYAAFVSYISELYNSGDYTQIFDTEANWQTAVTTYGVCGKFVYDSVNNTVRLPKITGFIEGATSSSLLGDLVEAGLPNITGSAYIYNDIRSVDGAFDRSDYQAGGIDNNGNGYKTLLFDASKYNTIYGNSNTVQPQAINVLYYIVVATLTKTEIEVDIDQIESDLSLKAETDFSNVNGTGSSLGAGWAMPSDTYDDLTLGASGATYTAPANGYFCFYRMQSGTAGYAKMTNTTTGFVSETRNTVNNAGNGVWIMARKNDVISLDYDGATTVDQWRFYYAQGSESEAS